MPRCSLCGSLSPGEFTKKISKPLHRENAGILDAFVHDPDDGFPMHAGILRRIFPLGFPVLETGGDELIEASHASIVGHQCPSVKALMPHPLGYPLRMAKRKARGVIESIVGSNLDALMRHSKDLSTNHRVAAKCRIPARTVGRLRNAETSCSIDTLAKIAKVFAIEPWHLLVPNYDPANPPVRTMTQAERQLYANMRAAVQELEEEVK